MERVNKLKDTLNELHFYEALLRHELSQNLRISALTNEIIRKLITKLNRNAECIKRIEIEITTVMSETK